VKTHTIETPRTISTSDAMSTNSFAGLQSLWQSSTSRSSASLRGATSRVAAILWKLLEHRPRPLPDGKHEEIEALISAAPEEVGSRLLHAICDSGVWIEQEAVAEAVLRA
jgi:hypothetical protein